MAIDEIMSWPALKSELRPWEAAPDRGESRRAQLRSRGPYQASVPPFIADQPFPKVDAETAALAEEAISELVRFDAEYGQYTAPFASILLRSESASSSEIEHLTAQPKNIAMAELGAKSGPNAKLVVANVRAIEAAIALSAELSVDAIISMQKALLEDSQPQNTGAWRQQQVWIGGGMSNSPHSAAFVPPHQDRVPALMDDLVKFCQRMDLSVLAQIAVAHAQFETIHPFPDGNGRTGRALVHSMLHTFGITRSLTVPVSAGLLQNTQGYFDALTAYRDGNLRPIVTAFAHAFTSAVANGRQLVSDLEDFRVWARETTSARRGSAGWRSLDLLVKHAVIDAKTISIELGVTAQNAQAGLNRLESDGIVSPSSASRRNRTYEAPTVLEALDQFAQRASGSFPAILFLRVPTK